MDFYNAWHYLNEHPIFNEEERVSYGAKQFQNCLDIEVVKVNPNTKEIDDNTELNTLTQVWLEAGPYRKNERTHDIDLDCGAETFEEAIIELAELVKGKYGDNPERCREIVIKQYGIK